MPKDWKQIDTQGLLFRAPYKVPGTTPYSTAIKLSAQETLIYSPGPGLEDNPPPCMEPDSKPLLLSPCLGHNLGLAPWKQAYPEADLFAPDKLHERIRKKHSLSDLKSTQSLEEKLPDHVHLHVLPQNKFHEVWLSIELDNKVYWLLGDAFLNFETVDGNFLMKFLLGIYGIKPGLRLHKIFRMGLKDKQAFRQWALPLFNDSRQHVLLPCHREVYAAPDCGERMSEIIQALR